MAFAALLLFGGCGTPNTDFGEVRSTLVSDGMHDWIGPYASAGRKASSFELTDDERALRDLAYPLIDPPYDRQQWYSVAGEYGLYRPARSPAFDRTAYAKWLLSGDGPSPLARYSPQFDEVRRDVASFVAARALAVGALCASDGRCAQRRHTAAAVLRNRHARARSIRSGKRP